MHSSGGLPRPIAVPRLGGVSWVCDARWPLRSDTERASSPAAPCPPRARHPPVPAVSSRRGGRTSEIIHREIAAGRAENLHNVLPDLMYTAVLPILGPEAAERELERGYPRPDA